MTKTALLSYRHPVYAKALYWGKLITLTGGAQVIVQATGLLTGVWIIRLLPTQEYAYYTLANTVLGLITMLSDGGVSNGVMAQGGKVWQDRTQLGVVLATGLALRRKFAIAALAIGLPILAFLLMRNQAGWVTTGLILLALLPSALAAISDSLLEVVPKLHQQVKPLQKNQTMVGIGRLLLSGMGLALFPFTWVAIFINGAVRAYGNRQLVKIAAPYADPVAQPDPETRREIIRAVKRILPITLYYCLSGQIIIWIPSLMGNTTGVAQIGALSRLAMVLNLVSVLVSTLILPRFARIAVTDRRQILKSFGLVQVSLIAVSAGSLGIFALFPDQFLWILGKAYTNLSGELILMILANCINMTASLTGNIIASRGWYIHPLVIITLNVGALVASLFLFDLSATRGVLYYTILLGAITYLLTTGYAVRQILLSQHHEKA